MSQVLRSFVAEIDDVNKTERSVVAKVSVGCVDRYNSLIDPKGIDLRDYIANPVVLFAHGKDPVRGELPVGRNLWIRLEKSGNGRLIAKTKFAKDDFSQTLYDLYEDGSMRGWSVSILPVSYGKPNEEEIRSRPDLANCDVVYRKSTLAEYSCVSVPGCQEALTLDELRSLSRVVSRGVPISFDIQEAIDRISEAVTFTADNSEQVEEETVDRGAKDDTGDEPTDNDDDAGDEPDNDDDDADTKAQKRFIKQENGKWCVYSEKGEKLGEYDSEEEAKKRLGEVEYFKHKDDRSVIELSDVVVASEQVPEIVETRDVPDSVQEIVQEMTEELEQNLIELPPLTGRTFQQVFDSLRGEEIEYRNMILAKMQEHMDWLNGKV